MLVYDFGFVFGVHGLDLALGFFLDTLDDHACPADLHLLGDELYFVIGFEFLFDCGDGGFNVYFSIVDENWGHGHLFEN